MKIILHVGMPKCGSSALQTFLSSNEFIRLAGHRYGYAAIQKEGHVISGDNLVKRAERNKFGYCDSIPSRGLHEFTDSEQARASKALKELSKKYDTLILSCEDWGGAPEFFSDNGLFARNEIEVDVLAWVRPQCNWLNSAWWQWGAWADVSIERWLKNIRARCDWGTLIQQWSRKSWVNSVTVRMLRSNVIEDFLSVLGVTGQYQLESNQSFPASILRLFQRHRELRPSPHDSAIEFALSRHFEFEDDPMPWVLDQQKVAELIDYYRAGNLVLEEHLESGQLELMRDDAKWFSSGPFRDKAVSDPYGGAVDCDHLEPLLVQAMKIIDDLDNRLRSGRR